MKTTHAGRVSPLLLGMITAGALTCAPMAAADPPDPGQQCPQQQDPPPPDGDQQQPCQQGPGVPNLPKLPQNKDQQQKQGRLSDTNCWMYPEGPEWFPPGAAPRPVQAGTQVWPCYYVNGLQPTLPGS